MTLSPLHIDDLQIRSHHLFNTQWLLLTCGDFSKNDYNTMTVSWGSLGTIWNRPFAQVFVRPSRYTYTFIDRYDNFTLSALPETYRKALSLLGSKSGRDGDKIAESGLTPIASTTVSSPAFAEAELVIECRKIYWQDMDKTHFLDAQIESRNYAKGDFHRIYFGEITAVLAR